MNKIGRIVYVSVFIIMLAFAMPAKFIIAQQINPVSVPPQDPRQIEDQLAAEFFRNGDWENAKVLYERLYEKYKAQHYYNYYFECLIQLKQYNEAEKTAKKALRSQGNVQNNVDLGYVLLLKGESKEARKLFEAIINEMPADRNIIHLTANAFRQRSLDDYALEAYTRGSKLPGIGYSFNLELSYLYQMSGNYAATMDAYLSLLETNPEQTDIVKNRIQSMMMMDFDNSMSELIREKILEKAQIEPDKIIYGDLLIWFALQQMDFELALIQARALDRRFGEQDQKIIELCEISFNNGQHATALSGYEYLLKKNKGGAFYFESLKGSIQARYQLEIQNPAPELTTLRTINADIDKVFEEAGFNHQTYPLAFIKSTLLTYYFDESAAANELLEKTKLLPLNPAELAQIKMHQADLLLFEDDVWEATLLYSQVDKAMKEEPLGHEARFRNARLRYFIGEFAWAQAQLDILKAATSKLIANDALQLSLLISDNLADDTTGISLKAFATADLRTWQKREQEADFILDSLSANSKSLILKPHILLKKAELLILKEKFQEADSLFSEIYLNYADHYLADDALYRSAQLNETRLNNAENARKLYEITFNQYPASIFAAQARQKYRLLRGDTL